MHCFPSKTAIPNEKWHKIKAIHNLIDALFFLFLSLYRNERIDNEQFQVELA